MYAELMLKTWLGEHTLQASTLKNTPAFYRNLEQALDVHRADHGLMTTKPRWDDSVIDWTTSDFLSLNRSGRIREAFKEELERQGSFLLSAAGSRVQYGNYDYLLEVEREVAAFHGAETAWIAHSGFFANVGIMESVPLPGDAIVYDELVHASTHLGMKLSAAAHKISFQHNDPDSLRDVLTSLRDTYPAFRSGSQSILICVESIYSMNGDICPLKECVEVVRELFPLGNAQFVIDEAHSTGVLGPKGAGLVQMLGLEKEIAIRVHMCSKALASTGGELPTASSLPAAKGQRLLNPDPRSDPLQQDHTTRACKPVICLDLQRWTLSTDGRIYSSWLWNTGWWRDAEGTEIPRSCRLEQNAKHHSCRQQAQESIQAIVKYFFQTLTSNPIWEEALDAGLLSCPLAEDWELRPCLSHIVPIRTRPRHEQYLFFHLSLANMNAYNISYPTVPKGSSRVRMIFHAHNTKDEVNAAVAAICDWASEMLDIENGASENVLPKAARQVYAMQAALS